MCANLPFRLLATAFTALFAAAGNLAAATIGGTVIDADLKVPLGSMVVAAYTPAGILQSTSTTDSAGRYLLGLPAGGYRVLAYDQFGAYATAFGNDADSFENSPVITVVDSLAGVNLGLRRGGNVTGLVFAIATGRAITGITVAAYNVPSGTRRGFTQSNSTGAYSLVLPPGQYKLAAYDDRGAFAPRFFFDQATFASASAITVTAGRTFPAVDFHLDFAGHLMGTVTDADTGIALPEMTVAAYSPNAESATATGVTDGAGSFVLNVPAGDYKLVAADPQRNYAAGYVDDLSSFNAQPALSLKPAQVRDNIRIPLHRAGIVSGVVTDTSSALLSNLTVAAYNGDGSTRVAVQTDSAGAYSLSLPPGGFRIGAFDNGMIYATQFYPTRNLFRAASVVMVSPGGVIPAIGFSLVRGGRFNGTVTDAGTRQAIPAVSIAAYDPDGNPTALATSDLSGNYVLVLPPGSYKFATFDDQLRYATAYGGGAPNYEQCATYQVEANSAQRLDFSIARGVRVAGTVVDEALHAVSGIQIGALDLEGNRVATTSTNDGTFDLVLLPNTYKLLATDPSQRFQPSFFNGATTLSDATPVTVQGNGVTVPLTFVLARRDRSRAVLH